MDKLEPLIIEFDKDLLKEYIETGRVCPVKGCGKRFSSGVVLKTNHFNRHGIEDYLEEKGFLRKLESGNPPLMGPQKKKSVHPLKVEGENLEIFE